jgi:adenylosuccinate synthase
MKIFAVIGLNYGDEGKGVCTAKLAKETTNPLVIRANGGFQVGHTVVTEDKRYVFSGMGSGSHLGVPTAYTRDTVVNPSVFLKEINERNIDVPFSIYVDPMAMVSTPFDMALNQMLESNRGFRNHGSVGIGFGVTVQRNLNGVQLFYKDLYGNLEALKSKLLHIRYWCITQFRKLALPDEEKFIEQMFSKDFISTFIDECDAYICKTNIFYKESIKDYDTLIFENGQGLQLDQDYGHFPYVTRSNTGFRNIGNCLKDWDLFFIHVNIVYVTRCYTTRHGSGPLPFAMNNVLGINVVDDTNIPNQFQGVMRLAPINFQEIKKAMKWDSSFYNNGNTTISTIVTCCDQIAGPDVEYVNKKGRIRRVPKEKFIDKLSKEFDMMIWSDKGLLTRSYERKII